MRPTQAPLRSSTALVATVVPCTNRLTSRGWSPQSASIRVRACNTARLGSLRVLGIFMMRVGAPGQCTTTSVNVPPISTPIERWPRALIAPPSRLAPPRSPLPIVNIERGKRQPYCAASPLPSCPLHLAPGRGWIVGHAWFREQVIPGMPSCGKSARPDLGQPLTKKWLSQMQLVAAREKAPEWRPIT